MTTAWKRSRSTSRPTWSRISVETFTALRAYKIARQFRRRGVPVVMGGYHVTLMPEEAAQEADALVIGDAEPVWQQLLDDARQRRLQPTLRRPGPSLLDAARPRREIFAGKPYQNITLVEFARGCNFKCDFCSITAFHGANQNHRPAREVAAEMAATGSRRFFIVDDNIVSQPTKVPRAVPGADPARHQLGRAGQHPHRPGRRAARPDGQERLPGRPDRHGIAGPGQPARHGQELEPRRRQLCREPATASASTAWRSTARLSLATTTTTARSVAAQHRVRPRAEAVPGGVQPSGALPGDAALSPAASTEGRLLKPKLVARSATAGSAM